MRTRRPVFAFALGLALGGAGVARAEDIPLDLRAPVRVAFAYSGITRGPALDFSWGVEIELKRLTKRLSLYSLVDLDSVTRLDLPSDQVNASLGDFGGGFGLFYLTDGAVAFGFDAAGYASFAGQDPVGGGLGAHAYVYPFYRRADDASRRHGGRIASYLESAISVWIYARVDFTDVGNGSTLAAGVAFDVLRALLMPALDLVSGRRGEAPD